MQKFSLLFCLTIGTVLLSGCRFTRNTNKTTPPSAPIIVEVPKPTVEPVVDPLVEPDPVEEPIVRDELDENGEFDPSKFQDDDIDEVMQLLKELTAE